MNAIKVAKRLIANEPLSERAQTLTDLVISLESGEPFFLERLYQLDMDAFEVATQIIEEWRLDRHYAKKAKLLDLSVEAKTIGQATQTSA